MNYKWIIVDHHIALDAGTEILHPDASEIYDFITNAGGDYEFPNPIESMPELKFSKIGSPIKCELTSNANGIYIQLYALRKRIKQPVDMVSGIIIDHCVNESEWFYIDGDLNSLEQLFRNAGITVLGAISVRQYLDLIKQEYFNANKDVENNVDIDELSRFLTPAGSVPVEIRASLYEYQKMGFLWMRNMTDANCGCILGDEMGLGKTLQVITVFQDLKNRNELPFLVVAPVSLLENWRRECLKFAPGLDVYVHHGARRTGRYQDLCLHDIIVISYNTAISDLSMLKMIEWQCVVLDEAQNIKNPYSERAKSVKKLNRKRAIAVTGTPFENHVSDIWSLVDFVVPDLLGTLSQFESHISDDVLGAEKIEPILSPIMIRRRVKDVANDLPEKIIIPQPLEMSDNEISCYERYRQDALSEASLHKSSVSLSLLQKLRMFCTHPALLEPLDVDPFVNSIKYQRFCEITEEILSNNEKVIVFTSYKKMFDIFLRDIPVRFGIKIDCINGDTPVEERQQIVDDFNSHPSVAMLVLNPRAAGTGLNITGANHVIHFNLEWNPALEDQSTARAFRRGQTKTVFVYRLYYINTVEEVVNDRINRKREIADKAIVGTDGSNTDANDIIQALGIAPTFQRKDDFS